MGAYRSTPCMEKDSVTDESAYCSVGASSHCGWRMHQEDAHVIHLTDEFCLFAVFDGHGGDLISEQAEQLLLPTFESCNLTADSSDTDFEEFVLALDQEIINAKGQECRECGCTSIICIMFPVESSTDKRQYRLKVLNSGDSRFVAHLSENFPSIIGTVDHKPTNPIELERIQNAGGYVTMDRVNGDLALSRALGDTRYKDSPSLDVRSQKVTACPDVYTWTATEGDILLLACDGIFDVKSQNRSSLEYVQPRIENDKPLDKICEELLNECVCENPAQTGGIGGDNMTAILIQLKSS